MATRNLDDAEPKLAQAYYSIKSRFERTLKAYELRPTTVYRTPAEQFVEFTEGRSELSGQTPDSMSKHNYHPARAIDVGIFKDGKYLPDEPALYWIIGLLGQSEGLRWGGSWRDEDVPYTHKPVDPYHLELRGAKEGV